MENWRYLLKKMNKSEKLWKIHEMYLSDSSEDKSIAKNWLIQLIGEIDANANLFLLSFHKDWDSDADCLLDQYNYYKMKFSTYKVSFGRDYRYTVEFFAMFNGLVLVDISGDYSRYSVGAGDPKSDLYSMVFNELKKIGFNYQDSLFNQIGVYSKKYTKNLTDAPNT